MLLTSTLKVPMFRDLRTSEVLESFVAYMGAEFIVTGYLEHNGDEYEVVDVNFVTTAGDLVTLAPAELLLLVKLFKPTLSEYNVAYLAPLNFERYAK